MTTRINPYYFKSINEICTALGISRQTFWRWNKISALYPDHGSKIPLSYSNIDIKSVRSWLEKVAPVHYRFTFRKAFPAVPGM